MAEASPKPGYVGFDDKGRFVHYCHCGAEASFGYGVDLRYGKLGQWYCAEHRPKHEALPAAVSVREAAVGALAGPHQPFPLRTLRQAGNSRQRARADRRQGSRLDP
jgi:hypothetical protein